MDYKDYLKSEHWNMLRNNKYRRKNKCQLCGSKLLLNVHHLRYKNLYDVDSNDLKVVCNRCHLIIHNGINAGELNFKKDNAHSIGARTRRYVRTKLGIYKPNWKVGDYELWK